MADSFDPYETWLGISPAERPASHYRLLDLPEGEADAAAITAGADRRMAHVKQFAIGPHRVASQRLLNELSAARVCLLNPARKAEYDATLARKRRVGPPPLSRRADRPTERGSDSTSGIAPAAEIASALAAATDAVSTPNDVSTTHTAPPAAVPAPSVADRATADVMDRAAGAAIERTTRDALAAPRESSRAPRVRTGAALAIAAGLVLGLVSLGGYISRAGKRGEKQLANRPDAAAPRIDGQRESAVRPPVDFASRRPSDASPRPAEEPQTAEAPTAQSPLDQPRAPATSTPPALTASPPDSEPLRAPQILPPADISPNPGPAPEAITASPQPADALGNPAAGEASPPLAGSIPASPTASEPAPLTRESLARQDWTVTLPGGATLRSTDLDVPAAAREALAKPDAEIFPWKDHHKNPAGWFQYARFDREKAFRLDGLGVSIYPDNVPRAFVHYRDGKRQGEFVLFAADGQPLAAGAYRDDAIDGPLWFCAEGAPLAAQIRRAGAVVADFLIELDQAKGSFAPVAKSELGPESLSTYVGAAGALASLIEREDREHHARSLAFRKWIRDEQERERKEKAIALGPIKRRAIIERGILQDSREQTELEGFMNQARRMGR